MSEKQFVLYEHKENYYILKNPRIHLDFIEMLGDALTSEEIVEELNQLNDKVVELAEENEQLKAKVNDLSNMELGERDIVCGAGRFRLEEWGKHRFHQFYDDDTPLEDEAVVIRLMELSNEVEQLRQQNRKLYKCSLYGKTIGDVDE